MELTLIRNATLLLDYAGKRFLIDPVLAEKGAYPGFPGTANAELRNPLVELPLSLERILDVDAVIVTHTHLDHWDDAAKKFIPKTMPLFVQNAADAADLRAVGFRDVRVLDRGTGYGDIRLSKTSGRHGSEATCAVPEMAARLGEVCGVVFRHAAEKTVYVAGDTVWNRLVRANLKAFAPDIVVVNAGWAQADGHGAIIMGAEDVLNVHRAAPEASIVATHMEAINHCVLSRAALRTFAEKKGFADKLLVPGDGESLVF